MIGNRSCAAMDVALFIFAFQKPSAAGAAYSPVVCSATHSTKWHAVQPDMR